MEEIRFAHPSEEAFAQLLDDHDVPWEYEPHTFPLDVAPDGRVLEAVTPDFYLPTIGVYVECTTMKPALASRKRSKHRRLRELHGVIVALFERADLERMLRR